MSNLTLDLLPALGSTFTYLTDMTLGLALFDPLPGNDQWDWHPENVQAEQEGKKIHVAQILRARDTASKSCCLFAIRDMTTIEVFQFSSQDDVPAIYL